MKTTSSFLLSTFIFSLCLGLTTASAFTSPSFALSSASTMLQFTITSAILVWLIQTGLSAFQTGQYLTSTAFELFLSLPFRSRLIALMKINYSLLFSSLLGFYSSVIASLSIAYSHGSTIVSSDLLLLFPVTAGTVAVTVLGISFSTLFPTMLTAPVLTLGTWILITADTPLSNYFGGYITASPFGLYTLMPNCLQVFSNSVLFFSISFLAIMLISVRFFSRQAIILSGILAILGFLISIILVPGPPRWFQTLDSRHIICKQQNNYSFCVITEQEKTLNYVQETLTPLIERLQSLETGKPRYRFSPIQLKPNDIEIPVFVPGQANYKQEVASALATFVLSCQQFSETPIEENIDFDVAPLGNH